MSEPLTKEKAQTAASAVGALILCKDVGPMEKDLLRKVSDLSWRLYDRADEEESE